jgi:hypothetical protein
MENRSLRLSFDNQTEHFSRIDTGVRQPYFTYTLSHLYSGPVSASRFEGPQLHRRYIAYSFVDEPEKERTNPRTRGSNNLLTRGRQRYRI